MKTAARRSQLSQKCDQDALPCITHFKPPPEKTCFWLCNVVKLSKKNKHRVLKHRIYQRLEDVKPFRAMLVVKKKARIHKEA